MTHTKEKTMNATQVTNSFINLNRLRWSADDKAWLKAVFSSTLKVTRAKKQFTVDDIWEQVDLLSAKNKLPFSRIDHRILGSMLRHMSWLGLLGTTGYYTKSIRPKGGARPVSIWESYADSKAAA
jgi:hypothetical protein